MDDFNRAAAPNYTNACIAMFGVNVTWIFFVLWAVWGLVAVAITGWVINRLIGYIATRRSSA